MDGNNISCFQKCSHLIQNPFSRSGFGQTNIIIAAIFNTWIKKVNDCLKSGSDGPQCGDTWSCSARRSLQPPWLAACLRVFLPSVLSLVTEMLLQRVEIRWLMATEDYSTFMYLETRWFILVVYKRQLIKKSSQRQNNYGPNCMISQDQ